MRIEIGAGQEEDREDSINEVKQRVRSLSRCKQAEADQTLHRSQAGHDQVAGPVATAHARIAEVAVRTPDAEQDRERHQRSRSEYVEKDERARQLSRARHHASEIL